MTSEQPRSWQDYCAQHQYTLEMQKTAENTWSADNFVTAETTAERLQGTHGAQVMLLEPV